MRILSLRWIRHLKRKLYRISSGNCGEDQLSSSVHYLRLMGETQAEAGWSRKWCSRCGHGDVQQRDNCWWELRCLDISNLLRACDIQIKEIKLKQVDFDCDRIFCGYYRKCKWWGQAWFHFQKWRPHWWYWNEVKYVNKLKQENCQVKYWNQWKPVKSNKENFWWTKLATFTWNWGRKSQCQWFLFFSH